MFDGLQQYVIFTVSGGGNWGEKALTLKEVARIDGFLPDDALVSACERHGLKGPHTAIPAWLANGTDVELTYRASTKTRLAPAEPEPDHAPPR